jgi:hypothetical protein
MKVFATVVITAATCFALTAVAGQARHGACVLHHTPCQAGQTIHAHVGDTVVFAAVGWGCEYQTNPFADEQMIASAPRGQFQLYCVPICKLTCEGLPEVDLYRYLVSVNEYDMADGQTPVTFKVSRT